MEIFPEVSRPVDSGRLFGRYGQMRFHAALKSFIQLVHFSVKLLEASFALIGHLLAAEISVGMNFKCGILQKV